MNLSSIKPFQINNRPSFQKFTIKNPEEIQRPVLYEILKHDEFKKLGAQGYYAMLKDKNELFIADMNGDTRDSFILNENRADVAAFKAEDAIKKIEENKKSRIEKFKDNLEMDEKIKKVIKEINKNETMLVLETNKNIPKQDVLTFVSSKGLAKLCDSYPLIVNMGEKVHTSGKTRNLKINVKMLNERNVQHSESVDISLSESDAQKIKRSLNGNYINFLDDIGVDRQVKKCVAMINNQHYFAKDGEEIPALVLKEYSKNYSHEVLDILQSEELDNLCSRFPVEMSLKSSGLTSSCWVKFVSGENSAEIYYDSKEGMNKEKISDKLDSKMIIRKWESENAERKKAAEEKREMDSYIKKYLKDFQ